MGPLTPLQAVGALLLTYVVLYINIMGTVTLYRWVKMKDEDRPVSVGILFNQYMTDCKHLPWVAFFGIVLSTFG
jgi:hypothetical protein